MNESQKTAIAEMRNQKRSYAEIAEALTISINTVKSYCRRSSLDNKVNDYRLLCKQCGRTIDRKDKCKPRQFCSDKCRYAWWLSHNETKRTEYHLICAFCGKPFISNGNKARKYCSHRCYISDRFGKGRGGDEQ